MRVLSWNVNGLRSIFNDEFFNFVEGDDFDVLCLQEIKVDSDNIRNLEVEGYNLYFNCAKKKGYSGVAVYCREVPKRIEFDLGMERFDLEGRMLILWFEDFVLVNLYLPHGGRGKENLGYKLEVYDLVLERLRKLKSENERVVVCGDFNVAMGEVDLARPVANRKNIMFGLEERGKLKGVVELSFLDSFREFEVDGGFYTWWPYLADCRGRNVGWRIDYVFVCGVELRAGFILKDVLGSDHCPVGVEF
jgi:exodeoxyribonuclease-3